MKVELVGCCGRTQGMLMHGPQRTRCVVLIAGRRLNVEPTATFFWCNA